MVVSDEICKICAGCKARGYQSGKQEDKHIFVCFYALEHILKCIMGVFVLIDIRKLGVVFLDTANERYHHSKEYHRRTYNNILYRKPNKLADKCIKNNSDKHYDIVAEYRLVLNNNISFIDIVGKRNRHGIHRHFYKRITQIIEQIEYAEPHKLSDLGNSHGHHKEQDSKNREHPKGQAIPRQVFTLAGDFSYLA